MTRHQNKWSNTTTTCWYKHESSENIYVWVYLIPWCPVVHISALAIKSDLGNAGSLQVTQQLISSHKTGWNEGYCPCCLFACTRVLRTNCVGLRRYTTRDIPNSRSLSLKPKLLPYFLMRSWYSHNQFGDVRIVHIPMRAWLIRKSVTRVAWTCDKSHVARGWLGLS